MGCCGFKELTPLVDYYSNEIGVFHWLIIGMSVLPPGKKPQQNISILSLFVDFWNGGKPNMPVIPSSPCHKRCMKWGNDFHGQARKASLWGLATLLSYHFPCGWYLPAHALRSCHEWMHLQDFLTEPKHVVYYNFAGWIQRFRHILTWEYRH